MIRLKGRANEGDGIPNLRALNRRIFFHSEYGVRNLGKRRPPALPSPRGEGGIRRSHARRMTDEVSCREGRGMLPQTAQGRNSSGFPTAAEIACGATEPVRSGDRTPCGARKTVRAYADPPVFRPLRKLRPRFFCRRQREAAILNNSKFGRGRLFFAGNLWYSVPIER